MRKCTNPLHQLESAGIVRPFESSANHFGVFRRKADHWEFSCLVPSETRAREIAATLNKQTLGELYAIGPVVGMADVYAPLQPIAISADHSALRQTIAAFNERCHDTPCEWGETH